MLLPKRTKFPKSFKSDIYGLSSSSINFGAYGIQSIISGRISSNQIEAARRVMTRFMKRQGQVWIRIFPYVPLTKKPNETRMGRGKGAVYIWYANIKANQVLFEFSNMELTMAQALSRLVSSKLSVKTKLIISHDH